MKNILNKLTNHEKLSKEESRQMIINVKYEEYSSYLTLIIICLDSSLLSFS